MMRTVRRAALLGMVFVLVLMPLAVAAQDSTPAATEEAPTEEVEIEATAVSTEESAEAEEEPAATVEGEESTESAEGEEAVEGEEGAEEEAHGEEANSIPQGISLLMFLLGILAVGIVGLVSIRARALEAEDETPPAE